ncbi:MAG: hypothetical protein H7138_25385, partial [Myxococcales bacterium]|nr:hypothetical protein [Myxococcales bacterium]
MTKINERLALVERQRRFEWQLARDIQSQTAGRFVSGKTHDLLNLVQIVQLAALELGKRCPPDAAEFIADLQKAAVDAQHQLRELMALARPDEEVAPGAPVGAAITAAVEVVRAASTIAVDLHLTISPDATTRCSADELAHLIYGVTLDAVSETTPLDAAASAAEAPPLDDAATEPTPIELFIRERTIDGKPWLEIVRGARVALDGEHFDLLAVEAIAIKRGGELAQSE